MVTDTGGLTDTDTVTITVTAVNDLPTASNVHIEPTPATETDSLTCVYDYSDLENDPEGTSTFKWFRNGVEVVGLTTNPISSTNTLAGEYWRCEVTPVAQTGASPGTPVQSANELIRPVFTTGNHIWYYPTSPGTWFDGNAVGGGFIHVAQYGSRIAAVTQNKHVWIIGTAVSLTDPFTTVWMDKGIAGGGFLQVSIFGNDLVAAAEDGHVYYKLDSDYDWTDLGTQGAGFIEADTWQDYVAAVTQDGHIWQYQYSTSVWTDLGTQGTGFIQVSNYAPLSGSNPHNIAAVTNDGHIWYYSSSLGWEDRGSYGGGFLQVSIAFVSMCAVSVDERIWSGGFPTFGEVDIDSSTPRSFIHTANGNASSGGNIAAVSTLGEVWYKTGAETELSYRGPSNGYIEVATSWVNNMAAIGIGAAPNQPPVADAGLDVETPIAVAVTLDGSSSYDPEGSLITYSWSLADGTGLAADCTTSGDSTANYSVSCSTEGTRTATLTVTDDISQTDSDDAVVTVTTPGDLSIISVSATNGEVNGQSDVNVYISSPNPTEDVRIEVMKPDDPATLFTMTQNQSSSGINTFILPDVGNWESDDIGMWRVEVYLDEFPSGSCTEGCSDTAFFTVYKLEEVTAPELPLSAVAAIALVVLVILFIENRKK